MNSNVKVDNPNPVVEANLISRLFFWWLKPIFVNCKSGTFTLKNLYNVVPKNSSEKLGDNLERFWNKEVSNARKNGKQPKLLRAIGLMFGWTYLYYAFPDVFLTILRAIQPIIMAIYLKDFESRDNNSTKEAAYIAGTVLVLTIILEAAVLHHCDTGRRELGMRLNIACSSLIYRKVMKLKYSSVTETTGGLVINLLSNDVARFDNLFAYLHYIWIFPFQIVLISYLLWRIVGIAALSGVLLMIVQTVPIQGYLGKLTSKLRNKIALRTDERVRIMSEIIRDIRVIKMYAWDKPFQSMISAARRAEVSAITIAAYCKGMSSAITAFTENISIFVTITTFVLLGNDISADVVYSMVQYFHIIEEVMSFYHPLAITSAAESYVSIQRIEEFLLKEEVILKPTESTVNHEFNYISITKVSAYWLSDSLSRTLSNIDLNIPPKQLCVIIGPVGSGKSSLLNLILGELQLNSGEIHVIGNTSIASQESWLFSGTIRSNIIFGQPYVVDVYNVVAKVCALQEDFTQLPLGDLTYVGNRGKALSGGQCARINLARAVYRNADIILLDDPLSAVDAEVGKYIFDNCINGYLKDKTRVLVTHQYQYLKKADTIILLRNGSIEFKGNFKEFQELDVLNHDLTDNLNPLSMNGNANINTEDSTTSRVCQNNLEEIETDEPVIKGTMSSSVYKKYFLAGGSYIVLIGMVLSFIVAQILSSGNEYWIAFWVTQSEVCLKSVNDNATNTDMFFAYNSSAEVNTNFTVPTPSAESDSCLYFSKTTSLYIYGSLIVSSIIMWTTNSLLFFKVCLNAGTKLHNEMFSRLLGAPVQFFDLHPTGRIHNRFTKDVGTMDEVLPAVMLDATHLFFETIGALVQVIVVEWWTIPAVIIIGYLNWKIRDLYLSTAQTLQRLESAAKSPVYSHVVSSLSGLPTIRSLRVQRILCSEFDAYQNVHTSVQSLLIAASSAIGFWLDLTIAVFIAFLTYFFTIFKTDDTYAGNVGLALTQTFMLCGLLQYGIRQTVEIAAHFTSVERIIEYTSLEQEQPFESDPNNKPSEMWPQKGAIRMNHLSLTYAKDQKLVLKDINIKIDAGMKVGIVGRTGAGKSSLIAALYRLVNFDGTLYIDGIDVNSIGLNDLRKNISIVPQEAMLFSASLRENLDPFKIFDDAVLWSALEDVEMRSIFPTLDHKIESKGSNLSCGQRQLLCLARVILQNNRILVLDEATANIDSSTNAIIQATIKRKFKEYTILTIAHRLNTIIDNDRILVIHHGEVVEFDHPHILLCESDSHFSKLIQQTGEARSKELMEIAERTYRRQEANKGTAIT